MNKRVLNNATEKLALALLAKTNAQVSKAQTRQFRLANDSYAMAYKSLNLNVQKEINLSAYDYNNAFYAACSVFAIQMLLVVFVATTMPVISYPNDVQTLLARFVVSFLMHL